MSLMIGNNSVVSMHYKLTNDAGETVDSSEGAEPLSYLHGAGNIIPGLENALTGKTEGDNLQVTVEPAEGYGDVLPELMQTVDIAVFNGVEQVQTGMAFEAQSADGQVQRVVVKEVDGDEVTIDANHPLAGQTLHFDVQVLTVRDATEEETAHGHAH